MKNEKNSLWGSHLDQSPQQAREGHRAKAQKTRTWEGLIQLECTRKVCKVNILETKAYELTDEDKVH